MFLLRTCIFLSFKSVITSTVSFEYTFIFISNVTFIPIFLPFIILHSINFIDEFISTFIPLFNSGMLKLSEKSRFVFRPLMLFILFLLIASILPSLIADVFISLSTVIFALSVLIPFSKNESPVVSLVVSSVASAKYIIYAKIFPSNFIFSSITSFLYIHTFPLVFIVFNISGFESGTIMSP